MPKQPDETLEIDDRTQMVLNRKGYRVLTKLSEGAYGVVYKAQATEDQSICAVKVMFLDKMKDIVVEKFLPREFAALQRVQHDNAVRVYDIFRMGGRIYIFMEFCENGGLDRHLKELSDRNEQLDEERACKWFTQVLQALVYMHDELGMAHRDIKIDNILLDSDSNAKLSDFGFARDQIDSKCETMCGTPPYYSPEIVKRKAYNARANDMWAMGVVLFAMLNNKFPFHWLFDEGPERKQMKINVKRMLKEQLDHPKYVRSRYHRELSSEAKELIEALLNPNERERITAKDALRSDWIKKWERR